MKNRVGNELHISRGCRGGVKRQHVSLFGKAVFQIVQATHRRNMRTDKMTWIVYCYNIWFYKRQTRRLWQFQICLNRLGLIKGR